MAHAAATPLAALMAFLALDALAPADGETVLVIGATGGVGSFFVQLAASGGAHVVASALPEDQDYLRSLGLGVAEILDRNGDLHARISERYPDGVDVVLDLILHFPQDALLKEGGRLASPIGAAGEGPGRFSFNVMARRTDALLPISSSLAATRPLPSTKGTLWGDRPPCTPLPSAAGVASPPESAAPHASRPWPNLDSRCGD